ncbi:WecB/TagA/CpsF family glycosyltransferase [Patescibacteria group bacterium]|nr:MAG: WecB/TagA/CpsF family glycosyltransferase [Patescibacteria group bacterium]
MHILDIRVDNFSKEELLAKVSGFLNEPKFHQIVTINPEFVLAAQKDEVFRDILNDCDLNVADGFGLNIALWKRGERLKYRMAGADLMDEILKIAKAQKLHVFVAIKQGGLSSFDGVKRALEAKFEGLGVSGTDLPTNTQNYPIDNSVILLCNFGAPEQEKFINTLKSDTIRLAIGVGGGFDFLTGKLKRAPLWMRRMGLEWLFRLIQQPKRIGRIWNAVVVFPIKLLFSK